MWPDWLKAYIPRTAAEHREGATIVHLNEEVETVSRRTGDPHTRRIRCVCRTRNNGWMSRLQERAKPYLVPMLLKHTNTLDRRAQEAASAWSAMMVMVAEHVQREMIAIPFADRARLRAHQTTPHIGEFGSDDIRAESTLCLRTEFYRSSPERNSSDWAEQPPAPTAIRRPRRYALASIFSFTS
jgi:hypothetical protein